MSTITINAAGLCDETTTARLALVKFAREQFGEGIFTRGMLYKALAENDLDGTVAVDENGNLRKFDYYVWHTWEYETHEAHVKAWREKTRKWLGASDWCWYWEPNHWEIRTLVDDTLADLPVELSQIEPTYDEITRKEVMIKRNYYTADANGYLTNRVGSRIERAMADLTRQREELESLMESIG